jgi:replication factor A1
LKIAEGLAADETACIKFRVAGAFAEVLKVGSIVAFRNGKSEVYNEFHRLSVD